MARSLITVLLGFACLASSALAQGVYPPTYPPTYPPPPSVAQFPTVVAAAEAAGLTALLAAIETANLTAAVADPDLQAIVLAPSNAAFADALAAFGSGGDDEGEGSGLSDNDIALLRDILLYHVLPAGTAFPRFPAGGSVLSTLLPGEDVTVSRLPNSQVYLGGVAPGALTTTNTTVTAARSRIYILDRVLLPPVPGVVNYSSISEFLLARNDLSTINALVAADNGVLRLVNDTDTAVTLFAPTNTAISNLLTLLGVTAGSLAGTATAARILRTHVVPSTPLLAFQIPDGTSEVTTASPVGTDNLIISKSANGTVTVQGPGNSQPIRVTVADILVGKSVVHIIDGVLLPNPSDNLPPAPFPPPSGSPDNAATSSTGAWSSKLVASTAAAAMLLGMLLL